MTRTNGSIDRRVARTRATLHQALMSLTLDKGYEAVTIGDICDTANIGRSTFYAHFPNKDALLRSGMDRLREMLQQQREASGNTVFGFSFAMLEHARSHRDLHGALAGGSAIAVDAVREILSDMVRGELTSAVEPQSDDAVPRELIVQYVVGALMAVVGWWLDGGAKLSAKQVDAMFRRLVTDGVMQLRSSDRAGDRGHPHV